MGQFIHQGIVYEELPDGQVRVVGHAPTQQPTSQMPLTIGTPDPMRPLEVQGKTLDIRAKQREAELAPYETQTAQANAIKAQADAEKARIEAAAKTAVDPATAKNVQRLGQDEVLESIEQARRNTSGWSTGLAGQLLSGIWGTDAADLEGSLTTIGSGLTLDKLAALKQSSPTGASGLGSLTEREGKLLRDSVAAIGQNQSQGQLLENLAKVELHYRRYRALVDGQNPDDPNVASQYGIAATPKGGVGGDERGSPGAGQGGVPGPGGPRLGSPGGPSELTSEGRYTIDPALSGVNAEVAKRIGRGDSAASVRAYLNSVQPGLGDRAQNVEAWVGFHKQNPTKPIDVGLDRVWQPTTGFQKTLGDIGMSGPGAAIISAADAVTGGTLDSMTDNPALTRAAMGAVQEQSPWWSMAGTGVGGALAAGGIEAGLARGGLGVGSRVIGSDLLYGAGYGAGSSDDDRLTGALVGGATGVGGGMFGRAAARGLSSAARGVADPYVRTLNERGVPMTTGQVLGGAVKGVEDRLAGFPIIGDVINARRAEGFQGFNRAAFDEGLSPIGATTGGQIGPVGVEAARAARSQAYSSALDPVTVQADAPFVADMQAAIQAGRNLPSPMREGMDYTLPMRVGQAFDVQGNLTGRDFQQAQRGLRRDTKAVESQPYGWDFSQVSRQAEDALEGLIARQSPDTLPAYLNANQANRNVSVLQEAVNRARNGARSGEVDVFTPSQLSDAAAANARKFGGAQGTTQQPFFELTRAGQNVLPSTVPDSGTAGRWIIPATLGAVGAGGGAAATEGGAAEKAGGGLTGALGLASLAAVPYSKTAQRAITKAMLAERPDLIVNLAAYPQRYARQIGMFASPNAARYAIEAANY